MRRHGSTRALDKAPELMDPAELAVYFATIPRNDFDRCWVALLTDAVLQKGAAVRDMAVCFATVRDIYRGDRPIALDFVDTQGRTAPSRAARIRIPDAGARRRQLEHAERGAARAAQELLARPAGTLVWLREIGCGNGLARAVLRARIGRGEVPGLTIEKRRESTAKTPRVYVRVGGAQFFHSTNLCGPQS